MTNALTVPAASGTELVLQGVESLSPKTREALGRAGAYLARIEPGDTIPTAFEIVQHLDTDTELQACALDDATAYRGLIRHVARLARQGLTAEQIADRFGIERYAMREGIALLPDLRAAVRGSLAQGIAQAADVLEQRIALGDVQAVSFLLKTKGGFVPPAKGPLVQINASNGSGLASVEISDIVAMRERQAALMESVDYSELD